MLQEGGCQRALLPKLLMRLWQLPHGLLFYAPHPPPGSGEMVLATGLPFFGMGVPPLAMWGEGLSQTCRELTVIRERSVTKKSLIAGVFMALLGTLKGPIKIVATGHNFRPWVRGIQPTGSKSRDHRGVGKSRIRGNKQENPSRVGTQEKMSNSRGLQNAVFSLEVNSKTPDYKSSSY